MISHPFSHLTDRCFICMPFDRLKRDISKIITNRIQPEISLDGDILYTTPLAEFHEVAALLKQQALSCTLHAPFTDLNPGATDQYIRTVSRDKLHMAFQLLPVFKPASIVCHLNYEPQKHQGRQKVWLQHALATWRSLLDLAEQHQVTLMLENTYETDAAMHGRIFKALNSPWSRFCLDVGHTLAFAKNSWEDWLPALGPWLGQLHLHDNLGDRDAHLAIGTGRFDFAGLFAHLKNNSPRPLITLEPHDEKTLWESLENLDRLGFLNEDQQP